MSFACLVCHSVESPSHSFRSYSVSSSDNEGRCSVIASCLTRKSLIQAARSNTFPAASSKVTPQPNIQAGDLMITQGSFFFFVMVFVPVNFSVTRILTNHYVMLDG
ncbi:hypothetical protein F2Q68_00045649 [Brassica cretica]|uniref:Uncharacterized protein n=1 Tax=Brassica cretica TaxID=69181 RepID=A0A8S9LG96_BRACR|nr:hypothetical protein F2Q68_00045649 [Brassica cretica]